MTTEKKKLCTYKDCDRVHEAKGLCAMHRERQRAGRDMDAPVRKPRAPDAICSVEGCTSKQKGGTLCGMHYQRSRSTTVEMTAPKLGTVPTIDTMMKLVNKTSDGCWEYQGAGVNIDGYGKIWNRDSGKLENTHRFSYTHFKGPIPKGLSVRHMCHNRCCCNPDHLELGSHQQNMDDMTSAGRQDKKLSDKEVLEILGHINQVDGTCLSDKEIGYRYGITRGSISEIKSGQSWSHLTGITPESYSESKKQIMEDKTKWVMGIYKLTQQKDDISYEAIADRYNTTKSIVNKIAVGRVYSSITRHGFDTIHTHNKISLTMDEWATLVGLDTSTLLNRITRLKWDFNKALKTSLKKNQPLKIIKRKIHNHNIEDNTFDVDISCGDNVVKLRNLAIMDEL